MQAKSLSGTVLYIAAWLISAALVMVNVVVVREASLDVLTAIQGSQMETSDEGQKNKTRLDMGFLIGAIDQVMLCISGITVMGLAIGLEHYFRKGQQQGKLLNRFGVVFGSLLVIFFVSVVIQTFL